MGRLEKGECLLSGQASCDLMFEFKSVCFVLEEERIFRKERIEEGGEETHEI